jgi:hypothetical protein
MSEAVRRRLAAALACAAALAAVAPAAGHQQTSRTANNRYVKLTLMGDTLRIAYTVLYGDLPALEERRAMDRDRDGQIAPAEARARAAEVAAALARGARLEVDGQPITLVFAERDLALADPRVVPAPYSIDLWQLVPLTPRPRHDVTFEAHDDLARPGETEVRFEEAPGTRLLGYCLGHGPCPPPTGEPRFVWEGPRRSSMEDRSVFASFAVVDQGFGPSRGLLAAAGGALAVLVAGVGALLWRRRRRG